MLSPTPVAQSSGSSGPEKWKYYLPTERRRSRGPYTEGVTPSGQGVERSPPGGRAQGCWEAGDRRLGCPLVESGGRDGGRSWWPRELLVTKEAGGEAAGRTPRPRGLASAAFPERGKSGAERKGWLEWEEVVLVGKKRLPCWTGPCAFGAPGENHFSIWNSAERIRIRDLLRGLQGVQVQG